MVTYETAFAVPVGPQGLAYSPGGPDRPPTGPNAFHIAPDGTCWISDNERSRVRRFAIDGKALETVELGGEVTGISSLAVSERDLVVLDLAAPSQGILRKDLVSGSATFAALPPEALRADGLPAVMVSRISLDDDQEVIAHARPGI